MKKLFIIFIIIFMIIDIIDIINDSNNLGRFFASISLIGFTATLTFEYIKSYLFKNRKEIK